MADYTSELIILLVSLPVGYLGKTLQDSQTARRARRQEDQQRWDTDRRDYYLPLLSSARELDDRLTALARIYRSESTSGLSSSGLSGDFRELYQLSPEPIHDLYGSDPNQLRHDQRAAQRVRTRMCRELNYATSSLYRTARFLALADLTRRHLDHGNRALPAPAAKDLRDRILAVAEALQGRTGAGLPVEQQDSIGELMRSTEDQVITQYEFRQRLLALPGWEQFTALLTLFLTEDEDTIARPSAARFAAKVPHEIRDTVQRLRDLTQALDKLTGAEDPRRLESALPRGTQAPPW